MINIDALNDDEKLAALESIHKSIAESKEIQKKKITTNVELIVKALKKIESDLKQRYDETGQLIANLKNGEDGRDGKDGKDGKNGRDGRDGPVGPRGYDGVPGRNGIDGTDGVSVTDAHIDFDGSLIISLSSGRVINVGEVVAADIAEKIKVITNGGGTSQGVLDAIASLQAQIDSIASGLEYQGTWNASTNVPTLTSSVGTAGYYYIVATAGSTNLNGVTDWQVGDWAVFNGSVWQKIDQTNLVTSVAGRTGAVVLSNTDISGLGTMSTQAANNVSITGGSITGITDLAIADGGTGQSTAAAAITALTGTQTSGYYLRSNGTSASLSAISAGDVPTLNQNTTGTAAGLSATLATTSGGTGLTSFTANGVVYASSTSALATGSSLTFNGTTFVAPFTSLSGNGVVLTIDRIGTGGNDRTNVQFSNSGTVRGGIGTVGASDGIYFNQGTTEGMRLTSTGLGIGTSSPASKLDVLSASNNIAQFSGAANGYVDFTNGTITARIQTSGAVRFGSTTNHDVAFLQNNTEGMRLNSTGLGIGTTSPTAKLDILGSGDGEVRIRATSDASLIFSETTANKNWKLKPSAGDFYWQYSATAYNSGYSSLMSLTSAGNLSNVGNLSVNTGGLATYFRASGTAYTQIGDNQTLGAGTAFVIGSSTPYLAFNTAGSEKMRITSAGNVGIGVTTPGTTRLVIRGDATTNFAVAKWSHSSNASSGFDIGYASSVASNDVSIWNYENGFIRFATNNTERARIDSSGNVGIGTTSPAVKLDVAGGSSADVISIRGRTSDNFGLLSFATSTGTKNAYIGSTDSTNLTFYTNGFNERARIDASGNFMVGTTSSFGNSSKVSVQLDATFAALGLSRNTDNVYGPVLDFYKSRGSAGSPTAVQNGDGLYQLRVVPYQGSAYTYLNSMFIEVDGTFTSGQNPPTRIVWSTNLANGSSTERMRLNASGNLGLGVTPSASWASQRAIQLASNGSVSSSATYPISLSSNAVATSNGWAANYIADGFAALYAHTSGQHRWFTAPSGTAGNAITFTQAMTLDASGNLLVGTTSTTPSSSNGVIVNVSAGNTAFMHQTGTASGTLYQGFYLGGTNIGTITQSGTTAVLYNTTSDQRLKENIVDAPEFGSVIDSIKVRSYDWKSDGSHQRAGFVAQELVTVAPEAVHQPEDSEEMMAVDYSKLVPMLVKEIQSLRKRLADAGI